MNPFPFLSRFSKKVSMVFAGATIVFGAIFTMPTVTASAATPTPVPYAALVKAYQNEQRWLGAQQTNLDKANRLATDVQTLITEAQGKGIDTTSISSALATFQSQLSTASSSHATAGSLLTAHNGFDGSGNVTDPVAAAQTVKDAGQALQDAHNVLVQATRDLLVALRTWENANQILNQTQILQIAYQNEQNWLTLQQTNLGKANTVVTNVQNLISVAQSNGLNTAALSTALTVFQSQLGTALSSNGTAASILSTHNGFDATGNVTDLTSATQTVNDARQSLMTAHIVLVQSSGDLRKAVNLWRIQNHVTNSSPVYPAFSQAYQSILNLYNSVTVENGLRFYSLDYRVNALLQALLKELS